MEPTISAMQKLLSYLGIVGNALKRVLGSRLTIELSGKVEVDTNVKLQIGLTPSLERIIERHLAQGDESPAEYWFRAIKRLFEQDEERYRALAKLSISDIAMGTEAMLQRPDNVPEMERITDLYIREYIIGPSNSGNERILLPPSTLLDAFTHLMSTHSSGGSDEITEFLNEVGRAKLGPRRPEDD